MKDLKRFGERDSINVDTMNNEGFGERDDLEREIWRVGSLEDFCYAVSQLISNSTHSLQLSPNNTKVDYGQ